jgi:hypothetical protein
MRCDELAPAQCRAIQAKVEPFRVCLHRLRVRLARRGFPPEEPLYLLVLNAQRAVGEMFVDVAARG